jgi:hypothetical protein
MALPTADQALRASLARRDLEIARRHAEMALG